MIPIRKLGVSGEGGAKQIGIARLKDREESIPMTAEANVVFDDPIILIGGIRPIEQEYGQIRAARRETEIAVVRVLMMQLLRVESERSSGKLKID